MVFRKPHWRVDCAACRQCSAPAFSILSIFCRVTAIVSNVPSSVAQVPAETVTTSQRVFGATAWKSLWTHLEVPVLVSLVLVCRSLYSFHLNPGCLLMFVPAHRSTPTILCRVKEQQCLEPSFCFLLGSILALCMPDVQVQLPVTGGAAETA